MIRLRLVALSLILASCRQTELQRPAPYKITVVDRATKRGVPLIELITTTSIRYVTDSAGVVAFDEPGLLGARVWFTVQGHGYAYPKDAFGFAGVALDATPGGSGTILVDRVNIAERLYRVTGQGLYRDSLLVGNAPPIREPLLNGGVAGQDSVVCAPYRGRLLWFWGDTNRIAYTLGNFHTSGAWSAPPGAGGLDPSVGVDLHYFTGPDGLCRAMLPIDAPGAVWIGGLSIADGGRLVCYYTRMKSLGEVLESGLAMWDEKADLFRKLKELPIAEPMHPAGQTLDVSGRLVFPTPYPDLRVRATLDDLTQPARYEGFTCLKPGDKTRRAVDRDERGRIVWAWKAGTPPLGDEEQRKLAGDGLIKKEERLAQLCDVETGAPVLARPGSVTWNAHRRRWIMIFQQLHGTSMLGETWYAESDALNGPWVYARKIVTHDDYSFYNVVEHPFFSAEGGRVVYFEGTYTAMFTGTKVPTPRYEYNQVMYRLDLADRRLHLPQPIYRWKDKWGAREAAEADGAWPAEIEAAPFFARAPDRPGEGSIALYEADRGLQTARRGEPVFYALPPEPAIKATAPLWEFVHRTTGKRAYATGESLGGDWVRSGQPLCRVWPNPMSFLPIGR